MPALVPLFDVFGVPLAKQKEVIARARYELVAKHPDLIHTAGPWLVRRILRICTEDDAKVFWGEAEIPDAMIFEDPPFFKRGPKDRDRDRR
ncbi:MAG TPA: hypothetical protein DD490_17745 [Acidobacteria bacterium]|nr:hypothetical protein [Acidobacteriota bacterium]